MSSVIVVATIKAKPGKEKALGTLLKGVLEPTHKENGCLLYALHQSHTDPSTFVFTEKWSSQSDLQAHLSSEHITAAMKSKDELIEVLDIQTYSPVAGGDPKKGNL